MSGPVVEFGFNDAVDLRFTVSKILDGSGYPGLTPLIKVVAPDGSDVTPSSPDDELSEFNASVLPGRYRWLRAALNFTQAGDFEATVDPNNAGAIKPDTVTFRRLAGAATTSPPSGLNLCTLEDVKVITGEPEAGGDAKINMIIPMVSDFIHTFTRRIFTSQNYVETKDGNGTDRHFLKQRPILTVNSVTIDGEAQDLDDIVVYENQGYIRHKSSFFPIDLKNVVVDYNAGYAVIPSTIVCVACEMAAHRFRVWAEQLLGVESEEAGEGTRTYVTSDFLPGHLNKLRHFRTHFAAVHV